MKDIVIKECTRIINQYIEICKKNNDEPFIKALSNKEKTTESCVNHIMNNLVKRQIFGGEDSLMYEYIHEYYVDSFTDVKNEWTDKMRKGKTEVREPSKEEILKMYDSISDEEKKTLYENQLKIAAEEAREKALEKLRLEEEKKRKKEEAKLKKEQERKEKELAEKKAKEPKGCVQMSLFDI